MIFGDPSDFAIEAMTETHLVRPSAVWGRMCLHIADTTLGDFDDPHCALYPAYRQFASLLERINELWDDAFNDLNDHDIYSLLDHAIYGDDDRTMAEIERDARRFSRFDFLTNWGEQFVGHKCFILYRAPDTLRILYRMPDNCPGTVSITKDGFVHAANGFLAWFDSESERLTPKEA